MNRTTMLQALSRDQFDLLVIGGGITGAGVAREAALRGLRVGLVEAKDFAYGTSSRSTKLIHGGLRYLKNMEFRLVRESVMERQRLLEMAPHVARATEFLFPVYRGDADSLWKLNLGLTLYDWFAGKGNPIPHRMKGPESVTLLEPVLRREGLQGGAIYCDSRTDDSRLTLEVIQSAAGFGAVVANYVQVDGFLKDAGGRITGVQATDLIGNERMEVRARMVLAAAGPWADAVRRLDDPGAPALLRLTKGVHLTVSRERLPLTHAVVMRGADQRMMFAVPSGGFTYLGTTDTDFDGDPHNLPVTPQDVSYILEAARRTFPGAGLTPDDVNSTWAGVRPLVRPADSKNPSATSRDYTLVTSRSGLVSVAGGKLTAFRAMAAHIIDKLFPATRGAGHLTLSTGKLPGAVSPTLTTAEAAALAAETGAPGALVEALSESYGGSFRAVAAEFGRVTAAAGDPAVVWQCARARHAVLQEMAIRLEDVVARRTDLLLFTSDNGAGVMGALTAEMGGLLGWSVERRAAELAYGRELIARMFAWRKQA